MLKGRAWILLPGEGVIRIVIQPFLSLDRQWPSSCGVLCYHWHFLFHFLSLTLMHAAWWSTHPQCMALAFSLKHAFACPFAGLSLTLMRALWWPTHLQCMALIFGLKHAFICPFISLPLTLMHTARGSTHPQCMVPAFGLKHTSVCPFANLSLTLMHAAWWSTIPHCMTLAFGLKTHPILTPMSHHLFWFDNLHLQIMGSWYVKLNNRPYKNCCVLG